MLPSGFTDFLLLQAAVTNSSETSNATQENFRDIKPRL
jgi:hypothetical protein